MTDKNLKGKPRYYNYILVGILIAVLGIFIVRIPPRLKKSGEDLAGVAGSKSIDALMRSLKIQKIEREVEAPGFELENLEGKKVRLKDYRGKVVLLTFMNTKCHACREEMPHLQKLYDRFKDRGFVIVSVFSDLEGARVVVPFIKESGYTFSISSGLLDPTGRVSIMYRIAWTPTSYLLDREGKIIGWEPGYREWFSKDARDLIEKLLESE